MCLSRSTYPNYKVSVNCNCKSLLCHLHILVALFGSLCYFFAVAICSSPFGEREIKLYTIVCKICCRKKSLLLSISQFMAFYPITQRHGFCLVCDISNYRKICMVHSEVYYYSLKGFFFHIHESSSILLGIVSK